MKKIFAVLLVAVMLFSLAACGAKTEPAATPDTTTNDTTEESTTPSIDAIKAAGKLVVGTSADYPPYEFHTEIEGEDTIVGFEMAIAQYIADELGVELEIVDMNFDNLLIGLSKGDFDLVCAGMTASEERQQSADFSDMVFENDQVLLIRTEDADKITDIASLEGLTIGAQTGSIAYDLAVETVGADNVVGLTRMQDLVMELKNGKIDAVQITTLTGTPYVMANEDLELADVGFPAESRGFSIAAQKGHEDLVSFLNELIAQIQNDGTLDQFIQDALVLSVTEEE